MDQNHQDHSWVDPVKGQRVRITGASGSSFAKSLEGEVGEVVTVFDKPDDTHDTECLPMFEVKLDSGPIWNAVRGVLPTMRGNPEFWCDELEVLDGSNS